MANNPRRDHDWERPIVQSRSGLDWGISLARVPWEFFATPTFRGTVPRPNIAYGMIFRLLQDFASVESVPYKRLLIALRGETGEKNGRFHFHFLVGGTTTRNNHATQYRLEHLWKTITGGARVDVRQYDRTKAGAEYIGKCLGANTYELNKYSFADTVTLSSSVIRLIACLDERGDRRCGFNNRKNGAVVKTAGGCMTPTASSLNDETLSCGSDTTGFAATS